MNFRYLLTCICAISFSIYAFSIDQIDSLEKVLDQPIPKVERALTLIKLAELSEGEVSESQLQEAELLASSLPEEQSVLVIQELAEIYITRKDLRNAVMFKQQEVEHWQRIGNKERAALASYILGKLNTRLGSLREAIDNYSLSSEIYSGLGMDKESVMSLIRIGIIKKDLEQYAEAMEIYDEAYRLAETAEEEFLKASISMNIGVVLKKQEDFDGAMKYYERAELIYDKINNVGGLADVYNNMGNVLRRQKKYDQAIEKYNRSIEFRNLTNDPLRIAYAYNNIGLVNFETKNYDKALEYYRKSEKIKLKEGDRGTMATTYLNIAEVYYKKKDNKRFAENITKAERLVKEFKQSDIRRSILVLKSDYYAQSGQYKKAYSELKAIYRELDTLGLQSQKMISAYIEAQFNERLNEEEIRQLLNANRELDEQKDELQHNQKVMRWLLGVLLLSVIGLVLVIVAARRNQRALKEKSHELELTNERLEQTTLSIEEKETLLREIHHRVKNNLQIIKSMIRLGNSGIENEKLKTLLLDFEQRVSSIALVHESLYKSGDLAHVRAANYFEELVKDLITAYNLDKRITNRVSIEVKELDIDVLIPLGLITNEIIANSLKYAFKETDSGEITVSVKESDGLVEVVLGDNGSGFDFETYHGQKETLGIELITTLVEQLDGELSYSKEDGSFYTIKFAV